MKNNMTIKFKKLSEDAIIPQYQTKGAVGFDIHSAEDVELPNSLCTIVKTGLAVEVPEGYELQIRSRSGLASKYITVANAPGTIDSDYRGEIGIILKNDVPSTMQPVIEYNSRLYKIPEHIFLIKKGDRIAQGVIAKVEQPVIEIVEELSSTDRGAGGFGSTGK